MSSPATVYAEHCERGELAFQRAADGTPVFPPRLAQPGTGELLEWAVSAGAGTVHATTVQRRRGADPANLALIELDEGFRMMSRVEGVAPEAVRIGMRVQVRFTGEHVPVFVPAS